MRKSLTAFAWFGLLLGKTDGFGQEPNSTQSIRVRLLQPDAQAREVARLFQGSRAPHPAAALAAWKRASTDPNRLGKPLEALIAAFNPLMADELRTLDGAEFTLRFDPESGEPDWSAVLPKDDGTFAALATALVLTGGAAEVPLGNLAVDRLEGPGSPFMARDPRGVLLARTREGLQRASERLNVPLDRTRKAGFVVTIEPNSLKRSKILAVRRVAEAIQPNDPLIAGSSGSIDLSGSLFNNSLLVSVAYKGPRLSRLATIDPTWLDWLPKDRTVAGFALRIDPAAETWDALFSLADRVDKLDPDRPHGVPLSLKILGTIATAGISARRDLLWHLDGVSGWVSADGKGPDGALVAFHLDDVAAAENLCAKVEATPYFRPLQPPEPGRPTPLIEFKGRILRISRIDRSVVVTWGDGILEASQVARSSPERSAGPRLRQSWQPDSRQTFCGGLWPGRLPDIWPEGSPLARALADAPPIAWNGCGDLNSYSLSLSWNDLDATVKRFLDLIPLDPPPDR